MLFSSKGKRFSNDHNNAGQSSLNSVWQSLLAE